jgi:hypothetical protein
MAAAEAGSYTAVVEQIESGVARIECLCSVYFQHNYVML